MQININLNKNTKTRANLCVRPDLTEDINIKNN